DVLATNSIPAGGPAPQLPPPAEKGADKPADKSAKPKLAFESLASAAAPPANPAVPVPRNSISDATQAARRPSAGGSGVSVGDPLEEPPSIATMNQIPNPGRMGSNLQLLSDPNGVDFKPYLVQVLTAVRH